MENALGKILVTGGAGYIGSHTTVELLKEGFEVVIIDNFSNSRPEVLDAIAEISGKTPVFYEGDCCNTEFMNSVFKKEKGIKAVIHFAAFKAVGESVANPLMYYRNNLFSLVELLDVMQQHGVDKIVFSSSCTVYGQPDQLPVTEEAPIKKAESPYGNTKQISEEILLDATRANLLLNVVSLRYFNPIGAHESALIGELPNGVPNNLVPFITQTAIGLREKLSVFGGDYNTPDGSCIRDYINVVDLAIAHLVAIKRLVNNNNKNRFEFFNLGTGNGVSVLEAIKAFEKVSGVKLNFQIVDRRSGDVEKVYADTQKANLDLGWKATRTLEETMLSAWNWELYLKKKRQNG